MPAQLRQRLPVFTACGRKQLHAIGIEDEPASRFGLFSTSRDQAMTLAAINRLVDYAIIFEMKVDSYDATRFLIETFPRTAATPATIMRMLIDTQRRRLLKKNYLPNSRLKRNHAIAKGRSFDFDGPPPFSSDLSRRSHILSEMRMARTKYVLQRSGAVFNNPASTELIGAARAVAPR